MEDFRDCLLRCSLFDAGFVGSSFTWCNNQHGEGRILARLDRCLVNDSGFDLQLQVSHMARFNSDHSPLLLCITKPNVDGPRPFKFLDVWLEDGGCLSVIKNSWVTPVCDEGDMSFRWFLKLKRLRGDLRDWNRNHFGDIFEKVKVAKEKLEVAQMNLESTYGDMCL